MINNFVLVWRKHNRIREYYILDEDTQCLDNRFTRDLDNPKIMQSSEGMMEHEKAELLAEYPAARPDLVVSTVSLERRLREARIAGEAEGWRPVAAKAPDIAPDPTAGLMADLAKEAGLSNKGWGNLPSLRAWKRLFAQLFERLER